MGKRASDFCNPDRLAKAIREAGEKLPSRKEGSFQTVAVNRLRAAGYTVKETGKGKIVGRLIGSVMRVLKALKVSESSIAAVVSEIRNNLSLNDAGLADIHLTKDSWVRGAWVQVELKGRTTKIGDEQQKLIGAGRIILCVDKEGSLDRLMAEVLPPIDAKLSEVANAF